MANFVLGAKDLERVLNQLPEAVAKKVAVNGLKAGGRVLVKGMKHRARRRTGQLADSPVVSSSKKSTKGQAHAVVGFKKPVSRRVHLTEFGTEHSRAFPFIRPTLDEDGAAAIKAIGENMGKGVEREARKLVGK
jgi:HK97 gp10 family phage protein